MIVDTNGEQCVSAIFVFGGDTINREYEIEVLQYDRLNEMGGPPGCLQFYTRTTAAVLAFNWQPTLEGIHS